MLSFGVFFLVGFGLAFDTFGCLYVHCGGWVGLLFVLGHRLLVATFALSSYVTLIGLQ